jgi:hypothetical protein
MAGFYEFVTGLQAPILGILRAKQPIVSGGHLKNSRFQEIAAGDRVRSALRGRAVVVNVGLQELKLRIIRAKLGHQRSG